MRLLRARDIAPMSLRTKLLRDVDRLLVELRVALKPQVEDLIDRQSDVPLVEKWPESSPSILSAEHAVPERTAEECFLPLEIDTKSLFQDFTEHAGVNKHAIHVEDDRIDSQRVTPRAMEV